MAYNEHLSDRIRQVLTEKNTNFEEKKMMGGVTYMVNAKMCVGVVKDNLMARIGPEVYEESLTKTGCHEMDFTKRLMKGFVFIDPDGWDMDENLEYWIDLCLAYNPYAKSSKK